jgi:hypothetical protein
MEVTAIRTARFIIHFAVEELNPSGKSMLPNLRDALVERYGFLTYPTKPEDFDDQRGIVFDMGQWNGTAISRLALYSNGILVDTTASTDQSEAILRDALRWASETYGMAFREDWFNQRAYLSELLLKRDKPLLLINPALVTLADRLSERVSEIANQPLPYTLAAIAFNHDPLITKVQRSTFRIELLADTAFSENRYYSSAPLPTKEHIELLNEFEATLAE